jgi:hypothetical protein
MKSSKMPFNTVKSKRIATVVDQSQTDTNSITRSVYLSSDGQLYEVDYFFKGIMLKDTVVKRMSKEAFNEWKSLYIPEYLNFSAVFEGTPTEENISYSLYQCSDGRYFEINRKLNISEETKSSVTWLDSRKIDIWKAQHSNLPHRDPANE